MSVVSSGVGVGDRWAYVVGGVVSVLIARSVVRASLREMIRCVAPSTISVLAAFAVVFPLEHVLVRSDRLVEPVGLGSIFVECLIFGLLYLGALRLLSPQRFRAVRGFAERAVRRLTSAARRRT